MELEGPDLVSRAQSIARRAHEGQTDKLGDDYIAHPQRVAERALFMAPAEDRFDCAAAGWLHDVVEDSEVTFEDLRRHGVPDRVLDAIDCLTKRKGTSRAEYFARIREDRIARVVKAADLADNCDPDRVFRLESSTRYRLSTKYAESWAMLMGVTA
ncbi:HD domain-containing protein [Brachybacterium paraconglomeratum]|uniref:HD domain-containing protein n=1 Tax=Brachybacterium paraconglomeratum TaxID=173362 RepID=UPI0022E2F476|nr:HD domain-containing protein [Brachybacterium paraconglomeratum]